MLKSAVPGNFHSILQSVLPVHPSRQPMVVVLPRVIPRTALRVARLFGVPQILVYLRKTMTALQKRPALEKVIPFQRLIFCVCVKRG